ncbi:UNVERIFIED_CONTAM: Auxin-responsive protein SAUR50 [Sesamum latifolium]|uniref:Auxin-responsive protein SAUR50 n=1 Tax=Sesamum latifolium TaxID=2727402 RepID=A0AAW2TYP3_9LAMI
MHVQLKAMHQRFSVAQHMKLACIYLSEPDLLFPPQFSFIFIKVSLSAKISWLIVSSIPMFNFSRMKGGVAIFNHVWEMLRKIHKSSIHYDLSHAVDDLEDDERMLPDDVKEGHFPVRAVEAGESTRFIVEVSCLADPGFLELLQKAEEEFGFEQMGILVIPCTSTDLQSVIGSTGKQ